MIKIEGFAYETPAVFSMNGYFFFLIPKSFEAVS